MKRNEITLKLIVKQRFYYLFEVLVIFLGIFLFTSIPYGLVNLIDPAIFEPLYYVLRAALILTAIPLFLYLANFLMEKQRKKVILKEDISPSKNFLNLFKITKKNFKFQLLYGALLLFLIFIPLDFFTYLLSPETLSYQSTVLVFGYNSYFFGNYVIFLSSIIFIPLCVAIYEESLTRGFLANRGNDYFNEMSAVIISSFFFGLGHFGHYLLNPSSGLSIVSPLIWFLQTFFVGIILAMVIQRRHWIFPGIFAHTLNNVITSHTIWNYIHGTDFSFMTMYVYLPLLIMGIILFIWQFSRIKESLSIGFKEFKTYFARDKIIKESSSDVIIRILMDFLFGLIIFLIGYFTVF
ncbi:MAG: CPBP family intramembrane metalloprotease [Candidatus Lokiarchaeota archaeon]|nr:CPBP family intramembrane metalloprotease [Candidatus Lokiarchaeota archaeon]